MKEENRYMNRKILPVVLLFATGLSVFALDFNIRPRGFVFIPLGEGNKTRSGNERYSVGGGGDLGFEIDLASLSPALRIGYTFGLEGSLMVNSLKEPAEGNIQMYAFGGGPGLYYFPLSRLFTRIDGALGVYQGAGSEMKSGAGLWWRGGGEIGFRFTPSFTLAANGGWRQYNSAAGSGGGTGVFNSGIYTGLTAQIVLETKSDRNGIGLEVIQEEGVYPPFLSMYQENPAATLVLRNNESAEIRNVRVSFRAESYTVSEFPCGNLAFIGKRGRAELPLYADFAPAILGFTENGRILGEVRIRYTLLGREREAVRSAAVQVHNRNTFPSVDRAGMAAFVSPTTPEILEFSKYITGMARTQLRTALNRTMQFGIWLFEGMKAYGIYIENEPAVSARPEAEDARLTIQFPSQTLAYKSGSALDAALLYAGLLEAAGIRAAVISLEDDVIAAFSPDIDQAQAETMFSGMDRVVTAGEEIWIPLSMNHLNDGFTGAWEAALEELQDVLETGKRLDFTVIEDCWAVYPPAPFQALDIRIRQPDITLVSGEAAAAVNGYIAKEIEPLLRETLREVQTDPSAVNYNRLGIVQTRAGKMDEAKASYERAAGMGMVPAMVNRGNAALFEKDYAGAERWFRQALAAQPDYTAARRALEQIPGDRE
jgi:tetratricopeptide (TPR) repeat protein